MQIVWTYGAINQYPASGAVWNWSGSVQTPLPPPFAPTFGSVARDPGRGSVAIDKGRMAKARDPGRGVPAAER